MSKETDSEDEIKKELNEDYYAGYYWGNQPYRSSEVPGRKSDEDLANDVLVRLRTLGFSKVQVRVANEAAILFVAFVLARNRKLYRKLSCNSRIVLLLINNISAMT
jgi:hypothetical protein